MKLNLISPFNTVSYGYVGCYLFEELSKLLDISAQCFPHRSTFSPEPKFHYIKESTDRFDLNFHYDAPCLKIWHQFDMTGFTGKGPTIGFPIFELNKFTDVEKHNLEYPDRLIVCSDWAKQIVLSNIDRKEETVHVVPLGVDRQTFKATNENNSKSTRFVNYGKWEVRKGHDILIEAFNRAFTPDDDVELFMSCENVFLKPHEHKEWVDFYLNTELGSKVSFIKRQETQEAVYNTMMEMDCGVFPARAEGWNLELLEMMSCGKSVITTNCTGHTEFCNQNNSMLIEVDEMELAYDGKFFNGQGDWYCLNDEHIEQLAEYMKIVHKKKQNNELGENKEGIKTAQDFTWENSAKKIVKVLEDASS